MTVKHVILKPNMNMDKIRKEFLGSDADALFLQAEYIDMPEGSIEKLARQIQGNIQCISGWVPASEAGGWNALKLVADNTIAHLCNVYSSITMIDYTSPECFMVSREIVEKIPFDFKKRRELKWVTGYKIVTDAFMNFCNDIYDNGYKIYMNGDVVCGRTFPPPLRDVEDPPTNGKNDKVVVMFAADDRYPMPLAVAIRSMLDHFPKDRELEIIVGDVDISQENKDKLCELWPIRFVKLDISEVRDIKINIVYHSSAIFARLLMPEILKDYGKALYFDCDIIIQDDITGIWDIDISSHVLAAAQDDTIPERDGHVYFNSGVLLINLELWRQNGVSEKAIKFVSQNITNFTDQDALNDILAGDFLQISKKWNSNPLSGKTDGLKIMHFLGSEKPWWYGSELKAVPKYFEILDRTPFRNWRPSMPKKEVVVIR